MLTLTVEKRDIIGKKAKSLRQAGKIPAVVYGKKEASTPISVVERDFLKIWQEVGESSVIKIAGLDGDKDALIHSVDFDPVTDTILHADLYVIQKGQKVEVAIPLEFVGVSPAVKERAGVLVKVLHEVEVEADPTRLPHELTVDISALVDFDSQILIRDIVVPEGVVITADPEDVVALVQEAQEEAEAPAEAVDLSQVEVEKKGKKEEGGEETAP